MVLCFDFGSSSAKIALIDQQGKVHCWQRFTLNWHNSSCAVHVWRWAMKCVASFTRQIRAISISGCSPALIAVNAQAVPLSALMYPQKEQSISCSLFTPLIDNYRREQAAVHKKACYYLSPANFFAFYLSGQAELPLPRRDFYEKYFWLKADQNEYKLPSIIDFYDAVGELKTNFCQEFSLNKIPIFVVAVDFFSSLLGCSALQAGVIVDRSGTSEGVNLVVEEQRQEPVDKNLQRWPHPLEPLWIVSSQYPLSGSFYKDYAVGCCYRDLNRELLNYPHQENRAPFFWAGKLRTKNDFLPQKDLSPLLFQGLNKKVYGRLLFDYAALIFCDALERLQSYFINTAGSSFEHRLQKIILSGGQALDPCWKAYKSWRSSVDIEVARLADSELLGNAIIAMVALKDYADCREACLALA